MARRNTQPSAAAERGIWGGMKPCMPGAKENVIPPTVQMPNQNVTTANAITLPISSIFKPQAEYIR